MSLELETADFAFDAMPGPRMHEVLRGYRERGPVERTRFLGLPAFVITGHEALLEAFLDVERFPPHRMYQAAFEGAVGKSFISMEDPAHRLYRKLATPAFRSRAVERYEQEGLTVLARELVDELADRREFDLMADFVSRFPYRVIAGLLGLPRDREEAFHRWAVAFLRFRDDPAAAREASAELTDFLAPIVDARRREPRDDVISELVTATVEGRRLEDEEVFAHVRLLIPTGGETTHGALGNLLSAVLTHEGLWGRLRDDPSLVDAAVTEALRWETPIAVLPRLSAGQPVVFRGVEIPADSWVLFAIAGANRDPAVHADPDRFDIDRTATDTLTFGRGVKSCPGMHLARRNLGVALRTLLEGVPEPELLDAESAIPRRTVLRCPDQLRIRRV